MESMILLSPISDTSYEKHAIPKQYTDSLVRKKGLSYKCFSNSTWRIHMSKTTTKTTAKTTPAKRVRTAVIPVAGLGTRFLPATKTVPKEMLPLLDRPCIDYIVAEAANAGIEKIVFITARGKDAMVDYFDRSPALEAHLQKHKKFELLEKVLECGKRVDVIAIRQRLTLGLGHAVLCAKSIVGDEPFAVLLGDDIVDSTTPTIGDMINIFI